MGVYTGEPEVSNIKLNTYPNKYPDKKIILGYDESIKEILSIDRNSEPYLTMRNKGIDAIGSEKSFYDWLITPNGYLNINLIQSSSAAGAILNLHQLRNNPTAIKPIDYLYTTEGFDFINNYLMRLIYGEYSV